MFWSIELLIRVMAGINVARVRDKDWLGFRVTYVTVTVRVGLSVRVGLGDGGRLELNQFRVRVRYGGCRCQGANVLQTESAQRQHAIRQCHNRHRVVSSINQRCCLDTGLTSVHFGAIITPASQPSRRACPSVRLYVCTHVAETTAPNITPRKQLFCTFTITSSVQWDHRKYHASAYSTSLLLSTLSTMTS